MHQAAAGQRRAVTRVFILHPISSLQNRGSNESLVGSSIRDPASCLSNIVSQTISPVLVRRQATNLHYYGEEEAIQSAQDNQA